MDKNPEKNTGQKRALTPRRIAHAAAQSVVVAEFNDFISEQLEGTDDAAKFPLLRGEHRITEPGSDAEA